MDKIYAVKVAALKMGAHDPEDILKHIDLDKVAFADGAIAGINEQIETIRKSKGYLFSDGAKKPDGANVDADKGGVAN